MKYFPYILILLFWFGIALLLRRPKYDLKKRIESYLYLVKNKTKDTRIVKKIHLFRTENRKRKMMKELLDSLSYLKNITILGRGQSISAELMLEELADFSPVLSRIYISMARSLSVNEKLVAQDALYEAIGTSYARDIGAFLASWEDIPQNELLSSIEAYLNVLKEEQFTKHKQTDETISDLVYFPVVVNCMLVLLNFVYVSYFLEQEGMLAQLFTL